MPFPLMEGKADCGGFKFNAVNVNLFYAYLRKLAALAVLKDAHLAPRGGAAFARHRKAGLSRLCVKMLCNFPRLNA